MTRNLMRWMVACLLIGPAIPLLAQTYGTGVSVNVPYVAPGVITLDGVADEAAWAGAPVLSMDAGDFIWEGGWNTGDGSDGYAPDPDIGFTVKLLYTDGKLLVYAAVEDYQDFYFGPPGNPGGGEQIIVGIDPLYEPGVSDLLKDDSWGGWVANMPDKGPVAYKVTSPDQGGITVNWGGSAVDSGYVSGTVFVDDDNFVWGFEMAIHASQIVRGGKIGFNIGGATAHPDEAFEYDTENGSRDYAWWAWHKVNYAGDVMHRVDTYSTLNLMLPPYGSGVVVDVPWVAPGTITLDGKADEAAWADAPMLSMDAGDFIWEGGWNTGDGSDGYAPEPDIGFTTKMLYSNGMLYVYAAVEDYQEFYFGPPGNPGGGEQIIVGIDPIWEPGVSDLLKDDSWGGWVSNMPDKGPVAYKVTSPDQGGVTVNWGGSAIDSGYVSGTVFVDDDNFVWGFELAIHASQIVPGGKIGFNIGGATAHPDEAFEYDTENGSRDYAWWAWHKVNYAGDVMHRVDTYSTLNLVAKPYGTGITVEVPMVPAGAITLDGIADEAVWAAAPMLSMDAGDFIWEGGWNTGDGSDGYAPDPDVGFITKMLYSEGMLYVYAAVEDYQDFYFGPPGNPGGGEQLIVGIDPTYEPGVSDLLKDDSWGGWVDNMPDKGPVAYKVTSPEQGGVTINWGGSAIDAGFVSGTVFVDNDNFVWGFEIAIHASQITEGGKIGFNIGGATAHPDEAFEYDTENGSRDYAWWAWNKVNYAGDVMHRVDTYSTLSLGGMVTVDVEENRFAEVPAKFELRQNYPNPFNPTTQIEYALAQTAQVKLVVYNPLGQRVAQLVDDLRQAGTYHVRWDAGGLPSGPYLYQLVVDGQVVASRKMVLVK